MNMNINIKEIYFKCSIDFILNHESISQEDKDKIDKYKSSGFKVESIKASMTESCMIDKSLRFKYTFEDYISVEWESATSRTIQKINLNSQKLLIDLKKFIDEKIYMVALKEMGDKNEIK